MKLIKKLHTVMANVGKIEMTGYNTFGKYDYAKESDILAVLKPVLLEQNVFLSHSVESVVHQVLQSAKGNRELFCEVKVAYTFYDADSEDKLTLFGYGTGLDVGDKALYKALTGAHKYFLSKNFNLSTGDDPENEQSPTVRDMSQKVKASLPKLVGNPLDVEVPFGANKGKKLNALSKEQLEKDLAYWTDRLDKDGKPPTGKLAEYLGAIYEILGEQSPSDDSNLDHF